jgi:long-chain acyl-CoA synthetase
VIISGAGKNIYPEEIESVLNAQPGIGESMVYGFTKEGKTGEAVAAIIVPDSEWFAAVNPDALHRDDILRGAIDESVKAACAQMAPYKRVVEWHLRHDPFEKTSTRKIKRAAALGQLENK